MFTGLRHRLRLRAIPESQVSGLSPGRRGKVVGKAALATPGSTALKAPITGRSCVFYLLDIDEWQNGRRSPLLREQSTASFRIEDRVGSAIVEPTHAQAVLKSGLRRGHNSDFPKEHKALLSQHDLTMLDELGELRSLTFRETIIAPGDAICVLGHVEQRSDPSGAPSYSERPVALILRSQDNVPLLLGEG